MEAERPASTRPSVCRACRTPSPTPLCQSCVRDVRPTFVLGCERCAAEFTSRDEEHRLCWECWKTTRPTVALASDEAYRLAAENEAEIASSDPL